MRGMGYVIEEATDEDIAAWKQAVRDGIAQSVTYTMAGKQLRIEIELLPVIETLCVPPEMQQLWRETTAKAVTAAVKADYERLPRGPLGAE